MTTVLSLVQTFADKNGLPTPAALIGATDKTTKQYRALLLETIRELGEYRWQQQIVSGSFVSVAAQLQGALTTLLGAGYNGLVRDTLWNATRRMKIVGPVAEQIWAALTILPAAGPQYLGYISRNNLYIAPTLPAGNSITCQYVTKYNVLANDNVTYKEFVTVDTDSVIFPDICVAQWFEYKWRKQKGEAGWEDNYNEALSSVAKNLVKEGGVRLSMERVPYTGPHPGIIIPPGSWGV